MRAVLCVVALSAAVVAPAAAETAYDRNLEKAAMDIVAGKIDDIRGGFSYKQVPQLFVVPEAVPASSVPVEDPRRQASGDTNDRLSPAIERPVARTIF
jgi:hypothetical protein